MLSPVTNGTAKAESVGISMAYNRVALVTY
jgi:hypothetical protein